MFLIERKKRLTLFANSKKINIIFLVERFDTNGKTVLYHLLFQETDVFTKIQLCSKQAKSLLSVFLNEHS